MKAVFLDFETLGPNDIDISELKTHLPNLKIYGNTTAKELDTHIDNAEILLVNKISLDAGSLDAASKLQLVCVSATGTDNIDLEAAKKNNIAVCNIRDYCTPSVTQHVFSMILSLNQHLEEYRDQVRKGYWQSSKNFCLLTPTIRELKGKKIGIIGLGTLGQGVAKIAHSFGMKVIAGELSWRKNGKKPNNFKNVLRLPLSEVLEQSDILSLHCPLNEKTHHLINAETLSIMKSDALLINTARGKLIDNKALLEKLSRNEIGGAGIDVLDEEPPIKGNILIDAKLNNLILTPHIAWSSREARQRAVNEMLLNILSFLDGGKRNRLV
ncbi:MAG: D-2-hydroxyacid dehydrogenase [Pseudomonadota bacterium]|nr:D-2-hydroxyacid dehydrogenase [Pseudomonadota bacterium]